MTDITTTTAAPSALRLASWAVPVALAIAGVIVQSQAFLNHDVAWVLLSSERLLKGGVFGRDIVAANPPLIWWVSAFPMGLARLTGLAPLVTFNVFLAAMLSLSLIASDRLLRGQMEPVARALFLVVAAFLMSFGAGRDFGQREHMTAILAMPYLLLVLARMRGEDHGRLFAVAVGIAAAIGFAFKPHLMVVPVVTELFLMRHIGFGRTLRRPEFGAAFVTVVAYIAAVLLFARPYLFEAAPKIAEVYWAFNKPSLAGLAQNAVAAFGSLLLASLLLLAVKRPATAQLFTIAAASFMVAAILQWKAYTYHLYPVYVYALLAVTVIGLEARIARYVTIGVLTFYAIISVGSLQDRLPAGETGSERAAMVSFVNGNTPAGGRFLAFSTHPFPGFPTALYTHASWASLSNSRIFLPAVVRLKHDGDTGSPALQSAIASERAQTLKDLATLPDLVLVDVKPIRHAILNIPFDYVAFYNEDPALAALWAKYHEVPGAPEGYRAYRLNEDAAS